MKSTNRILMTLLLMSLGSNVYQYIIIDDLSAKVNEIALSPLKVDTVYSIQTEYIDRPIPKYITRTVRDSLIKTIIKDGKIVKDTVYIENEANEYADKFTTKDSTATIKYNFLVSGELLETPKFEVKVKQKTIVQEKTVLKKIPLGRRIINHSVSTLAGSIATLFVWFLSK